MLVLSKIGDCEPERISLNQIVWHRVTEEKDEVGCVERSLDLNMLGRRICDLIEINRGFIGSRAKVFNRHLPYVNVDVWGTGVLEIASTV